MKRSARLPRPAPRPERLDPKQDRRGRPQIPEGGCPRWLFGLLVGALLAALVHGESLAGPQPAPLAVSAVGVQRGSV